MTVANIFAVFFSQETQFHALPGDINILNYLLTYL